MTTGDWLKKWLKVRCLRFTVRFPIFNRPTRDKLHKSAQHVVTTEMGPHTLPWFQVGSAQPWSKMQNFIEYFSCRAIKKRLQPKPTKQGTKQNSGDSYCKGRLARASGGWGTPRARRPLGARGPPQQAGKRQLAAGSVPWVATAFCWVQSLHSVHTTPALLPITAPLPLTHPTTVHRNGLDPF